MVACPARHNLGKQNRCTCSQAALKGKNDHTHMAHGGVVKAHTLHSPDHKKLRQSENLIPYLQLPKPCT